MQVGPFHIATDSGVVRVEGKRIVLTKTELQLLLRLAKNAGVPQERDDLLRSVWGYSHFSQTRTLDTHIKRLRAKLGAYGACIETVRSVGYVLCEPP